PHTHTLRSGHLHTQAGGCLSTPGSRLCPKNRSSFSGGLQVNCHHSPASLMCVCVCVCVCERERERERERACMCVCAYNCRCECVCLCVCVGVGLLGWGKYCCIVTHSS